MIRFGPPWLTWTLIVLNLLCASVTAVISAAATKPTVETRVYIVLHFLVPFFLSATLFESLRRGATRQSQMFLIIATSVTVLLDVLARGWLWLLWR